MAWSSLPAELQLMVFKLLRDFDALWDLFDTLSSWKEHEVTEKGLSLELSAHSPSDSKHFFKKLDRRIHDVEWYRHTTAHERFVDKYHFWHAGQLTRPLTESVKARVLGNPRGLRFDLRAASA